MIRANLSAAWKKKSYALFNQNEKRKHANDTKHTKKSYPWSWVGLCVVVHSCIWSSLCTVKPNMDKTNHNYCILSNIDAIWVVLAKIFEIRSSTKIKKCRNIQLYGYWDFGDVEKFTMHFLFIKSQLWKSVLLTQNKLFDANLSRAKN